MVAVGALVAIAAVIDTFQLVRKINTAKFIKIPETLEVIKVVKTM